MKNTKFINNLKKYNVYVISPHFDDAVLSMGYTLYGLKDYKNVTVINCFTKAHSGPYTISGKQFLATAGFTNAEKLYEERLDEDKKVLTLLNAKRINLNLEDALFRRKNKKHFMGKFLAEFDHLYPTYKWHLINKIHPNDPAVELLGSKLMKIIKSDDIIFAPYGIGGHTDHMICHNVASKMFKNVVFYVDFPYNIRLNNYGKPADGYRVFEQDIDLKIKTQLTNYYKTQINGLFARGIVPPHKEKFFLPKEIAC